MLSSYRALLVRSGARELALVCALAWLAFSGYGLALILAVHHATGSYASAGAAVAVQSGGAAAMAPLRGRLVDRHRATALRLIGYIHAASGALLTIALVEGVIWADFVGAALVGLTVPPLIAVARTRWSELAGQDLARTAHALNAALSDGAQIATPAAVAGVALAATPTLTPALLIAAASSAALVLARRLPQRPTVRRPRIRASDTSARSLFGALRHSRGLRVLAASDLATAGWLAGLEIAVIALAGRHHPPALGALILAASAVGSITMSLLAGGSKRAGAPATRYRIGTVLASAAVALTLLTTQLAALVGILLGTGAAFGVINVAFYELLDDVSLPDHTTEAFTWLTTASATGAALGALVAGQLAATSPRAPALFVTVLAAAAALIALSCTKTLPARTRAPSNGQDDRELGPNAGESSRDSD